MAAAGFGPQGRCPAALGGSKKELTSGFSSASFAVQYRWSTKQMDVVIQGESTQQALHRDHGKTAPALWVQAARASSSSNCSAQ